VGGVRVRRRAARPGARRAGAAARPPISTSVDTETDKRLDTIGTPEALALRGKLAIANAKLAYQPSFAQLLETIGQKRIELAAA